MGVRGRGKGARRKVRARWPRLHSLHINTHSVEEGEETFLSNRRERERGLGAPLGIYCTGRKASSQWTYREVVWWDSSRYRNRT